MRSFVQEIIAGVSVLAVLIALPLGLSSRLYSQVTNDGVRIIHLTGVKKDGVWTDEVVDGTTYWHKTFRPASVVIRSGEAVLLRLSSVDVTHGFYVPELGIGPLTVEPGHVVEVRVRGEKPGNFMYYCTAVCGHCHYYMKGFIHVLDLEGRPIPEDSREAAVKPGSCALHRTPAAPPPDSARLVERGAFLFAYMGCSSCHGDKGRGGVKNENYLAGTVPQNNLIAEKMGLFDPEEAKLVIELLEKGADLNALQAEPPFRTYPRFLAQYMAVKALIQNGNPAGKKDPAGPTPPLNMPAWRDQLDSRQIDSLVAYLVSQYPWE